MVIGKSRTKKLVISLALVTLTIAIICILLLTQLKSESHYNVSRKSVRWKFLFANSTISRFPILQPVSFAEYNWLGNEIPAIKNGERQVIYTSSLNKRELFSIYKEFFKNEGYTLEKLDSGEIYCSIYTYYAGNELELEDDSCINCTKGFTVSDSDYYNEKFKVSGDMSREFKKKKSKK